MTRLTDERPIPLRLSLAPLLPYMPAIFDAQVASSVYRRLTNHRSHDLKSYIEFLPVRAIVYGTGRFQEEHTMTGTDDRVYPQ
jgi:hypothetical protein